MAAENDLTAALDPITTMDTAGALSAYKQRKVTTLESWRDLSLIRLPSGHVVGSSIHLHGSQR